MKNTFSIVLKKFTQQFADMVLIYSKALNNGGKNLLLLNLNPKTRFLDQLQRPKNLKNIPKKNILSDLVTRILILFVIKNIL